MPEEYSLIPTKIGEDAVQIMKEAAELMRDIRNAIDKFHPGECLHRYSDSCEKCVWSRIRRRLGRTK